MKTLIDNRMVKNKAVIFVYYNGHGGIGEDVEKSDDF